MDKQLILKILANGVEISHFAVLHNIAIEPDLRELWADVKFRGYRDALIRKGMVGEANGEFVLTERGKEVYTKCVEGQIVTAPTTAVITNDPIADLATEILAELKVKIKAATGKPNMILKSGYPYLPSQRDLTARLIMFCQKFQTNDYLSIKRAIFAYTDDILSGKLKSPRKLIFFLYKDLDNGLVSDIQAYIENLPEEVAEVQTEKIDTRKLF